MGRAGLLPHTGGSHSAASTTGGKAHGLPEPRPVENEPCWGVSSHCPQPALSVPSEIFPYLVVVIGLENVLVLTKSVVSTPVDLEVKLRIAQGNGGVGGAGRAGSCAALPLFRSLLALAPCLLVGGHQVLAAC